MTVIAPRSTERVHDPADRDFVAGDLLGREDHRVALDQLELVAAERDPRQRRARLALPAGGDDHHLVARQAHRLVEADGLGEIEQIAGGLGDAQDAVERAAGDAHLAPGLDRDLAERLQPRGVGGEGGDQHAALGGLDRLSAGRRGPRLRSPTARPGRRWSNRRPERGRPRRRCRSASRRSTAGRAPAFRRSSSRRCGRCCRTASRSAAHCPRGSSGRAGRR